MTDGCCCGEGEYGTSTGHRRSILPQPGLPEPERPDADVNVKRFLKELQMDYIDLVVHVFSKSARAYYDLERLWRDAKKLDVDRLLKTKATKPSATRAKRSSG